MKKAKTLNQQGGTLRHVIDVIVGLLGGKASPGVEDYDSSSNASGQADPNVPLLRAHLAESPIVYIIPASRETRSQSLLRKKRIDQPLFVIGRRSGHGFTDPQNIPDLLVAQTEPYTISKRHCALGIKEDGVHVIDLGGRRGTLVDDVRIGGRSDNPKELHVGRGEHSLVLGPRSSKLRFKLIVE